MGKKWRTIISLGGLLVAIALACGQVMASDSPPVYPTITQADADGYYTWTLTVTNASNPNFAVNQNNNVSQISVNVQNTGGNNWKITVVGRLVAIRESGYFIFSVDPDASIFNGTVTVLAGLAQAPMASGWSLLSLLATLAILGTLALMSRRIGFLKT